MVYKFDLLETSEKKTYSRAADNKVAPKQNEVTNRMAAETL